MAKKLSLTIIIANLISLVLMTGLLTVFDSNSLVVHLFVVPLFAIILFFSLVTKQVGQTVSHLLYSAGLLIYAIIVLQAYYNLYITGLLISGTYSFIATILSIAMISSSKKKKPMQDPPMPIQVYQEPTDIKPIKTTTKKKVANKTAKKTRKTKTTKKKAVKKNTKKATNKKKVAKKTTKKTQTSKKKTTKKKPSKSKKVTKTVTTKKSSKTVPLKKRAKNTKKKTSKTIPSKKGAKKATSKGKTKTVQTEDGKQIVINIQN